MIATDTSITRPWYIFSEMQSEVQEYSNTRSSHFFAFMRILRYPIFLIGGSISSIYLLSAAANGTFSCSTEMAERRVRHARLNCQIEYAPAQPVRGRGRGRDILTAQPFANLPAAIREAWIFWIHRSIHSPLPMAHMFRKHCGEMKTIWHIQILHLIPIRHDV